MQEYLKHHEEISKLLSLFIIVVFAVAIISLLFFLIEVENKHYKEIFIDQVNQLGQFIQNKEIQSIEDNIKEFIYYGNIELHNTHLKVTLKDNTTESFKLHKVTIKHRANTEYAIQIKTSENPSNEPLVTIYVPYMEYLKRIREQEKIQKQREFVETNYSTAFTSKGVE